MTFINLSATIMERYTPMSYHSRRPRLTFPGLAFLQTLILLLGFAFSATTASAHVFSASKATISFDREAKNFGLRLDLNIEAILAGVDPSVKDTSDSPQATEYNRLRALPPAELQKVYEAFQPKLLAGMTLLVDGKPVVPKLVGVQFADVGDLTLARPTTLQFQGDLPDNAKTFSFGWLPEFGKVLLRTAAPHARTMHIETIEKGATSSTIIIDDVKSRTTMDMVLDFVGIGFHHILPEGLDHILFVVGLFLLSTKLKPILTQITAFTLAHTLTLGLGTAGLVNLPQTIVEPLIAASIVYVAVENVSRPTLSFWRPFVVFGFGLLHGLGFAGTLRDFKLQEGDFLTGLLSFNVGVELGQLTVIAACYGLVGVWFGNKPWYRQRVVIPASLVIAGIAGFWFLQRVGLLARA